LVTSKIFRDGHALSHWSKGDPEFFGYNPCTPEKALCGAILGRAMLDALGAVKRKQKDKKRAREDVMRANEALEWLEDPSDEPFSYRWICSHLDLDPELTLKAFRKRGASLVEVNDRRAFTEGLRGGRFRTDTIENPLTPGLSG
jgi:hypothetical protein